MLYVIGKYNDASCRPSLDMELNGSTSIVMNRMNPCMFTFDRDNLSAKFWVNPVSLARNLGFGGRELRQVERLVRDNQTVLLEAWNGYFGVSR